MPRCPIITDPFFNSSILVFQPNPDTFTCLLLAYCVQCACFNSDNLISILGKVCKKINFGPFPASFCLFSSVSHHNSIKNWHSVDVVHGIRTLNCMVVGADRSIYSPMAALNKYTTVILCKNRFKSTRINKQEAGDGNLKNHLLMDAPLSH